MAAAVSSVSGLYITNGAAPRRAVGALTPHSAQRLCDCMWVFFDPRKRTIRGLATVAGGWGAVGIAV